MAPAPALGLGIKAPHLGSTPRLIVATHFVADIGCVIVIYLVRRLPPQPQVMGTRAIVIRGHVEGFSKPN